MIRPPIKQRNHAAGFTILEILIATLLIGIGIFTIFETFNRGFAGMRDTENYSLALSLSQERLEELKDSTFSSIVVGTATTTLNLSYNKTFTQTTLVVQALPIDPKTITVTTSWVVPGASSASVSLVTKIANTS